MNDEVASPEPEEHERAHAGFLIAAAGGSAGALAAFTDFLRALPANAPLAIVLVQHLSSEHESLLVDLLGRVTEMPLCWATAGTKLEPRHIYALPPKSPLILRHGRFVTQPESAAGNGRIIDSFFRAFASDCGHRAVGIIFSGSGTDGVHGLKAINVAGGTVFAQREDTASFPSMPHAAIKTGCVDSVLSPVEIAYEIARMAGDFASVGYTRTFLKLEQPEWEVRSLADTFKLLQGTRGVDFTAYRQTTIKRRIFRRMLITQCGTLPEYFLLLEKSRSELDALFDSLLINVTEFFRDPDTFDYLAQHILPGLIESVPRETPIRIWVPGCSTGQEAYSLCILVREILEHSKRDQSVQLFGTDLSEPALNVARAGVYSAAEVAMLSPERVARFFDHRAGSFSIKKSLRDHCIFARQNVVKDAPYSRLDLISCRNLLIYFDEKLQRKVLPIFHYALNPHGVLTLGSSESIGDATDLFRPLDRRHRVYARSTSSRHLV